MAGRAVKMHVCLRDADALDAAAKRSRDDQVTVRTRVAAYIHRPALAMGRGALPAVGLLVLRRTVGRVEDERDARRLPHLVKQGEEGGVHLLNIARRRAGTELRRAEILTHAPYLQTSSVRG